MKILVIADDLTGAAEIGGMVLRYGLSVEIVHTLDAPITKDVRILNTNTRSLKIEEALAHLKELFALCCRHCEEERRGNLTTEKLSLRGTTQSAFSNKWDWIYLKFDSALRGHIAAEISFYREVFQKDNVVFCPVNPTLDRYIQDDGVYRVKGKPIAETDFARDPEFPIVESDVLEVLGAHAWQLAAEVPVKVTKDVPYIVAAVKDEEDLNKWASTATPFGIYAGAAAFFEALLRHRVPAFPIHNMDTPVPKPPILYVCGSKHENSVRRVTTVDADKVVYWRHIGQEREVARDIRQKIDTEGKVVFAVAPLVTEEAHIVRTSMAQVVAFVQQEGHLQELLIEGGATAGAVLEALAIDRLLPVWEYGQGVIRNKVADTALTITLKPGSYPWTEALWVFRKKGFQ